MSNKRHRFFNTYLTATVSVALVLLLVGLECVVGLTARTMLQQVKENTTVTVVLSDNADSADSIRLCRVLDASPFCRSHEYISKDSALTQHIQDLGEDPTLFLGYNPIRAAMELHLVADYVQPDSLLKVEGLLSTYPFVEEVQYPRVVVDFFNRNVGRTTIVLLCVALVLLIISIVLIVNTIRLTVYSRRFIIRTMQLVGATPWMIRWPIVRKSMLMGLWAALLALGMIAGVLYYAYTSFGMHIFPLTWQNILFVALTTLLSGQILTFASSVFAVSKYIRMKVDDLYTV